MNLSEEIEELFNAPWESWEEPDCLWVQDADGKALFAQYEVYGKEKHKPIRKNMNRVSYLPELYEALIDAAYKTCHDCIYVTLKQDNVPLPNELIENGCVKYDLIEKGCIFKERDCCPENRSWIELLRKVRDGK